MKISNVVIGVALYALPLTVLAQTDPSEAQRQRSAIQEVMVALNKSTNKVGSAIFTDPQSAEDAGCLDALTSIDLSVFRVDITSVWSSLADTVKDRINDLSCSAASDWAAAQESALATSMDIPFGAGTINVSLGTETGDWQSVTREQVELSNAELDNKVTTGTLGQVPQGTVSNRAPSVMGSSSNEDTPTFDSEAIDAEFPTIFRYKQLWAEPE